MNDDPRHVLPTHERRRLLSVVTGNPLHEVYDGMELTQRQARRYHQLGLRRMAGEPLQYLEGSVQFGPLTLAIDKRALIPRPETERLWERCVELLDEPEFILDLCTGSGCLALALKHVFPGTHVVATDVSREALGLAQQNAQALGAIVEFREGDLYEALPEDLMGAFDLIVSNPPYVEEDAFLPMEVREHEPSVALRAGPDGLALLRPIVAEARRWLAPGGILALEIGETQGEAVVEICGHAGFSARVEQDLAGRDRYVIATRR